MIRRATALFLTATAIGAAQIPAFPGAEGYGAYAKGGRGGDVYHVTNLGTSGVGSFADAIATVPSAGRTIVFDVSGHIHVNKTTLAKSNVTIAGQTAPGDGIGFRDGTFIITGDDIVIRHVRFRYGKKSAGGDCIDLSSGTLNAILDQVSIQFSTDENISSFGSPPENLTMQWSLNGWGLESHSCGGLWDQNHASAHHSLWAHNHTRNPKARPNGLLEWVNNVTYDWDIGFIMGDSNSNAAWKANVRGCYFLCPPGNLRSKALEKAGLQTSNGLPNFSLYLDNCLHDADGDGLLNGTDKAYGIASGSYNTNPTAFAGSPIGITIDQPLLAFKKVVSKGGPLRLEWSATHPLRDEVDAKMINNVLSQTRNHITSETSLGLSNGGFGTLNSVPAAPDTDRDGMPDYWESAVGTNLAVDDHNGQVPAAAFIPNSPAGYTNLEEYLHFKASPHAVLPKNTLLQPTFIDIDLRRYTAGFTAGPTFTTYPTAPNTTAPLLGTAVLQPDGFTMRFTPTVGASGRARFDFTVKDTQLAAGQEWKQTFYLIVTSNALPNNLKWQGGLNSNAWDNTITNNWLNGATLTTFSSPDTTLFDDTGALAVTLSGTMIPGSMEVNATGSYTFSGSGAVTATGPMTKRGSGMLTINNGGANNFASALIESGSVIAGQTNSLGSGPVTFGSASLSLPGGGGSFGNALNISGSAAITWTSNSNMYFNSGVSGSGPLTLNFSSKQITIGGSWAGYSGTLDTGTSSGTLRINDSRSLDYSQATVSLGNATLKHHLNNAQSMSFSALNGNTASFLSGGDTDYAVTDTYTIGALNKDSMFSGTIVNGYGLGRKLAITKTGSGTLTLGGDSTYTGATAVNAGGLMVNGSLGATATTIAPGATLAGAGSIGGQVTLQSGAFVAPGISPGALGQLTAAAGFSATASTFVLNLSSSPGATNDKIMVTGGSSFLVGANIFQINFTDGILGAGVYKLVDCAAGIPCSVQSGMTMTLSASVPTGTRQTFVLGRDSSGTQGGNIRLTVTGSAANLVWVGSQNGATWNLNSTANFSGAAVGNFYNLDAVTFDDTSTNRTVILAGSLAPRSVVVNTTAGYTLGGTGTFDGSGSLVKNGTGTLTLAGSSAHTFSGGLTLTAGTIALDNDVANSSALGTGLVTMNGGVIAMHDDDNSYNSFNANLVVPAGATARINADSRVDLYGSLSGGGTLNYYVPWIRSTLFTNWSAFTGTINILTDASGGDFRMGTSYNYPGFPHATVALSDKVWAYYTGTLTGGAGTTIEIGGITGTALATLQGGATGGRALAYRIGGNNADATFAGTISEQNTGTATTYIKTGSGTWTLSGQGAWNGGTTVEQGTLKVTGVITCLNSTDVQTGTTFQLSGGILGTDALNIAPGAFLSAFGSLTGDLNVGGTMDGRGFSTGTSGTLAIQGNAFFDSSAVTRLRGGVSSDLVNVTGDLSLSGTIQIALAAGTGSGRYPLMTYSGNLALGTVTLTGIPAGTTAQLSTSIGGQVDLVVGNLNDSDYDGLVDSWETTNFNGSLAQIGSGDPDGDGFDNETEESAGTNPNNSSSIPDFTVAYYRFEDGAAGTLVPQAFSNAVVDSAAADDNMNAYSAAAAAAYNATVPAATVPQTTLANTRSLLFDGGDDIYNALGGPVQTRAFSNFTLEAYVRFTTLSGFQTIVGRDDTFGNANGLNGIASSLFYLSKSGVDNSFRVELTNASGGQLSVNSTFIAALNTWYHLAAVGNAGTATLTLYVNGNSVGSVSGFNGLYNPVNDNSWTIGRGQYAGAVADYMKGNIDEVRFCDFALAPSRFLLSQPAGDSDGDGLPNAWESQYFGSSTAAVAGEDSDGDGQSNAIEYFTGTHPKNGSSRFAASFAPVAGSQFSITWPSVAGKSYTILTSASLSGPWTTLMTAPAAGAPAVVTTRNVDVDGTVRFYKVALSP